MRTFQNRTTTEAEKIQKFLSVEPYADIDGTFSWPLIF
jgi:hypothetical protein